ncbi:hypothetical protein [Streptomyces sp. NPDC058268]|uniref:hypothetical protein n=1 Tax=Streptomyces sp. NPDC058268 TaxID=3346413 RepID=UPI0036EAA3AB
MHESMEDKKLTIPFVGVLEVTVGLNACDEDEVRDAAINGMQEYLAKDMAAKWMSGLYSAKTPTAVTVPTLFETFPRYVPSAPSCRKWREDHFDFSHAWAQFHESTPDSVDDQVEREDDVTALVRELETLDVTADPYHTGGGCMVAQIEMSAGYFLWSSAPDGTDNGYVWEVLNSEQETVFGGTWPKCDAAQAAQNIAALLKLVGEIHIP